MTLNLSLDISSIFVLVLYFLLSIDLGIQAYYHRPYRFVLVRMLAWAVVALFCAETAYAAFRVWIRLVDHKEVGSPWLLGIDATRLLAMIAVWGLTRLVRRKAIARMRPDALSGEK